MVNHVKLKIAARAIPSALLCCSINGYCGGEDQVRYIDVVSASVQRNPIAKSFNGDAGLARYWGTNNNKTENHFLGAGLGVEFNGHSSVSHVLAKYSHMGIMGLEVGPKFWANEYGGMIRSWVGFFCVGAQATYSYTNISNHAVDVGVYLAIPIGEHVNGNYIFSPNWFR